MFGRKKNSFPDFVVDANGKRPTAASPIAPVADGRWLGGWPTELGIMSEDGSRETYEWAEFENGAWDDERNLLTLTFVDPQQPPLSIELPRDADEVIITMVRERVDRSIVYQQFADLPSGGIARGQVRRNADETLFTQIIVDHDISDADRAVLNQLESELREAVGLRI